MVTKTYKFQIPEETPLKRCMSLFLVLTFFSLAFAQNSAEKTKFDAGLDAYKSGSFQSAQNTFLEMLQQYPNGQYITGVRLMLAKSYYKLSNYTNAEVVCKYFFTKHPESAYTDDVHHLLGNTLFKLRKYDDAVEEWISVIKTTRDPRLRKISAGYIYETMANYVAGSDLEAFQMRHANPLLDGIVKLARARKLSQSGQNNEARRLLRAFLREQPDHIFTEEAQRMLGGDSGSTLTRSSGNRFLFLKSLEPQVQKTSEAMVAGMEYALKEYKRRNPGSTLELTTTDVEPTVVNALNTVEREIEAGQPLCVIGPLNTDQNASLALVSRYEKQPYVVPLSSQHGLANLSPYTFQINPDTKTKGRFLGEYAAKELAVKRLAIIAPVNNYGQDFVESFQKTAEANGSEIVTTQWYYETAQDFTRQFRAIWREGFYLAFRDSVVQSDSTVGEDLIRRKYRTYLNDIFKPSRTGTRIDSTDLPATGIDGLLIVIRNPDFIQFFAKQLAFSNIRTTLIGNEGWNDPLMLRKNRQHLEGLVYTTAGYYDSESPNYQAFMNRFRTEMRETPQQFHLLGYDIMKWLLSNYSRGISPDALRDRLENARLYEGVLANIRFKEDAPRVNRELTVLRLNLGHIIRLNN